MPDNEYTLERVDFAALAVGDRRECPEVGVLAGEGIGPAILDATLRIVNATGARINWHKLPLTSEDCRRNSGKVPAEVLKQLTRCDAILMGPLPSLGCSDGSGLSGAQIVRRTLGLLVHKTEVLPLPGLGPIASTGLGSLRVFRERPECVNPTLGEDTKSVFEHGDVYSMIAARIAEAACADGARLGLRRVTAIPDLTHPNWCKSGNLSIVRKIVEGTTTMRYEETEPKAFAARAVGGLEQFQIVLTSHSFGEIACHLSAAMLGGAHLVPSVTFGTGAPLFESFIECSETVSDSKAVNPTAMVRAAILMLDHIGEDGAAGRLRAAVHAVYRDARNLTPDVGGHRTTIGFTNAVIQALDDRYHLGETSSARTNTASFA